MRTFRFPTALLRLAALRSHGIQRHTDSWQIEPRAIDCRRSRGERAQLPTRKSPFYSLGADLHRSCSLSQARGRSRTTGEWTLTLGKEAAPTTPPVSFPAPSNRQNEANKGPLRGRREGSIPLLPDGLPRQSRRSRGRASWVRPGPHRFRAAAADHGICGGGGISEENPERRMQLPSPAALRVLRAGPLRFRTAARPPRAGLPPRHTSP